MFIRSHLHNMARQAGVRYRFNWYQFMYLRRIGILFVITQTFLSAGTVLTTAVIHKLSKFIPWLKVSSKFFVYETFVSHNNQLDLAR